MSRSRSPNGPSQAGADRERFLRTGPAFPLRPLWAGLLLGAAWGLLPPTLGAQVDSSEGASSSAQSRYTPLQYTPAGPQANSADGGVSAPPNPAPGPNDDDASAQPPANGANGTRGAAADNSPPISFQPLTITTRPQTDDIGFAPVVGTVRDVDGTHLVNSSGGLPRLYAPGLRAGPFDLDVNATLIETYNDNIYLAPQGTPYTSDFIFTISPSATATYANGKAGEIDSTQFSLFYAPSGLLFSQHGNNSALNQFLNASLTHRFSRLAVNLNQTYVYVSGGEVESGNLVDQTTYTSSIDADYALTEKTSLELASAYAINQYSSGLGYDDFLVSSFVNYQIRPKLTIGVGPSFNALAPQGGGNQTSAGGNLRVTYQYSEKTTAYVQLGADEHQYSGSDLSNIDLTYLIGAAWAAGPKTDVVLNATRKTNSSSVTANQDYVASDVGVTISQSLVDRFAANFVLGYQHADYYSTLSGAAIFSSDFFSISPGLTFHPTIWSDIGISYLYRQELTSTGIFQFDNNQISLFSTIRF